MATVTGLTADRMLAIEAASVVDGDVIGDNLILTKHDGSQINAGSVRGPKGDQGPVGQDLVAVSNMPVLDIGIPNQIRAGRQLAASDFTAMGLSVPIGLWNLSNLADSSGNGRDLLNKGVVPFANGINGIANTAAQFSGSTAQGLYISDTGANDPFRIRAGSMGCWFKTAKAGVNQNLIAKRGASSNRGFDLYVGSPNVAGAWYCGDGTNIVSVSGLSSAVDDRWHFVVFTFDNSSLKLYFDGVLEGMTIDAGTIYGSTAPFNIGTYGADAGTAGAEPFFGRIDEAFITGDVLTDDQVRNLYCTKIAHTLGSIPSRGNLNVRRGRKGGTYIASDFPSQPLRLYNFSAGSLGDEGSNGVALINNGVALSVPGSGGSAGNAFNFNGSQNLSGSDTGLPSGTSSRSYGFWFKCQSNVGFQNIVSYGALNADTRTRLSSGALQFINVSDVIGGPFVADGLWHFIVVTEENAPLDGVKRKAYLDSRIVGTSLVLTAITLGGTSGVRVGCKVDATELFTGQVDGYFICNYVLTCEQIAALYAKSASMLVPSPKNLGDHVEAFTANSILAVFDTIESQHQIDLRVAA